MSDMIEVNGSRGFMPRRLNVYERQIMDGSGDIFATLELVDGWVRTVASETDFNQSMVDTIVDRITDHVVKRYEDMISPADLVDEIIEKMTDNGLAP